MTFGELITSKRNETGFSLRKMADLVGVTHRSLRRYEDGEYVPPPQTMKIISHELRINMVEAFKTAGYIDDLDFKIIKTKNGRPTVIEYDGHRYTLQHPNQYGRS